MDNVEKESVGTLLERQHMHQETISLRYEWGPCYMIVFGQLPLT